jgi:DNA polymerase-3 subunit alpha (Gram-positive type)
MEDVRLGKGLTGKHKEIMKNADVPEWYIESCEKIEYLLPNCSQ